MYLFYPQQAGVIIQKQITTKMFLQQLSITHILDFPIIASKWRNCCLPLQSVRE